MIIESAADFCRPIQSMMKNRGLDVHSVKSTDEALNALGQHEYCLVMLDCQEVDENRMRTISMLRAKKAIPILVITDILQSERKIELFHAGAHAHIEKPVDVEVCIAQAYALMKLYNERVVYKSQYELTFSTGLTIKPHFRQVLVDGKSLELTRKEFDLLYFLAKYPGQVFSCEQLYTNVWNDIYTLCEDKTVKVQIGTLRKKLKVSQKDYIQNVWGIGYKFVLPNKDTRNS